MELKMTEQQKTRIETIRNYAKTVYNESSRHLWSDLELPTMMTAYNYALCLMDFCDWLERPEEIPDWWGEKYSEKLSWDFFEGKIALFKPTFAEAGFNTTLLECK